MLQDPIVQEVRTIRENLAAKLNHDIKAIVEQAKERQKKSKNKIVSFVNKPRSKVS